MRRKTGWRPSSGNKQVKVLYEQNRRSRISAGGDSLKNLMKKPYFLSLMAACAAARRAMGTRNGEQLT